MDHDASDQELIELRRARDRPLGEPFSGDRTMCEELCDRDMLEAVQRQVAEGDPNPIELRTVYEVTALGSIALQLAATEGR